MDLKSTKLVLFSKSWWSLNEVVDHLLLPFKLHVPRVIQVRTMLRKTLIGTEFYGRHEIHSARSDATICDIPNNVEYFVCLKRCGEGVAGFLTAHARTAMNLIRLWCARKEAPIRGWLGDTDRNDFRTNNYCLAAYSFKLSACNSEYAPLRYLLPCVSDTHGCSNGHSQLRPYSFQNRRTRHMVKCFWSIRLPPCKKWSLYSGREPCECAVHSRWRRVWRVRSVTTRSTDRSWE